MYITKSQPMSKISSTKISFNEIQQIDCLFAVAIEIAIDWPLYGHKKKNLFVLATRTTHSLCNVQNYSPICRRASTAHLWIIFNMETQKTQRNCIICSHSVTCCYFIRALNSWVAFHHNSINVNEMNVMTLSQNSSISLGIFAFKCEITNHENRYRSNASHHHIRFCQTIQQRAI